MEVSKKAAHVGNGDVCGRGVVAIPTDVEN